MPLAGEGGAAAGEPPAWRRRPAFVRRSAFGSAALGTAAAAVAARRDRSALRETADLAGRRRRRARPRREHNFGPDAPPKGKKKPQYGRGAEQRGPKGPIRTKTDGRIYNAFDDEGEEAAAVDFDDFATSRPEDEAKSDDTSRPEDEPKSDDE